MKGLGTVVAAALVASPIVAHAQSAIELFTPETVAVAGDIRVIGVDGEPSWLDRGFGKTRFDTDAANRNFRIEPQAVEGDVIWTPRFSWSLGGTVVATAQQGQDHAVDLSEAFLTYKPLLGGGTKLAVRGGLFWPPVSLEHAGPEWRVRDTITPSAINSWIGDEVKVAGLEAQVTRPVGSGRLSATLAVFGLNDTAGTLLAFRGWALHDQKAVAFGLQPLPPLNAFFVPYVQATKTRPVIELDNRPGFYGKLDWAPTAWLDVQAFHYDNRGNPEAVTPTLQWGWRTRFDNLGAVLSFGDWRVKAQGMAGKTLMGFPENGRLWVDTSFRSGYVMATRNFAKGSVSVRGEAFGTTSIGSELGRAWSEKGWALTAAGRRDIGKNLSVLIEALHVDSRKDARASVGLSPDQDQTLVQFALRVHL
ncbi:hypothetical protein FPZ24_05200 [Sphingomonas panacisoli]|uniref:Porin n=1 Tax=Sphingomonas panacisoli TaxID=1813879 RepID=A0A5B8LFW1_9SPHN|nr:hypothetical protein [Sphingomonas panacisoli]QDZ06951.1 hypothetical protein FPZ24_05200 [Sphingomonas panacisoli]